MKAKLVFNLKDDSYNRTIIMHNIVSITKNNSNADFVDITFSNNELSALVYNNICEVRSNLICTYYEHKLAIDRTSYVSLEII